MDVKARASKKLKEYLQINNLTVRGLADQIEVSPHTIKKVLEQHNYTVEKLQEIFNKIGISL